MQCRAPFPRFVLSYTLDAGLKQIKNQSRPGCALLTVGAIDVLQPRTLKRADAVPSAVPAIRPELHAGRWIETNQKSVPSGVRAIDCGGHRCVATTNLETCRCSAERRSRDSS